MIRLMRTAMVASALVLSGAAFAAAADGAPTFTKDVAPILYAKCVSAAIAPGEVAPMSLHHLQRSSRPWAKAIRGKVQSREMPPWGADPTLRARSPTTSA